VYRICGFAILLALVLIALFFILPADFTATLAPLDPVFWLESAAVVAFGVSWFVKGEGILKDKK